ncbi:ArsR family transcriptional regulator [Palaeococcus sp. (in: euryarchaeotes)]|uniref:ArsR family transcriptional regulator n=1 Tax=Palaeococcus sp. (in: euryarchaeotes) TaxID=2820298 RepID=UPI000F2C8887|nr:ArsR family transcriptional regulator [Palaeococcus sp. (in: euryarchaeotes)]MCD6558524.1 ArsR family transcriptional regulator [Palaeococcus sp. (in: euryarchaeotes)]RLF77943.1 MAG: ArsR family transcriptional regulator [Thermococci archaeon]
MKHLKVLESLEGEEGLTVEGIAEKTNLKVLEVRKVLMRLSEQGKVESFEREGKIYWKIKEVSEEEKKLEKEFYGSTSF